MTKEEPSKKDRQIARLKRKNRELKACLVEILSCPMWIDPATVPSAGIDAAPEQVVLNASFGYLRLKRAQKAIK